ncbi:hypothetical protein [Terrisporobacter sp.]|uniref:hypothetical protein n=1 Tax=Terrisporobacter sp. TaxID=1965305 RepID=UPI002898DFEE|nr:hypothetical protein [Terrisporobacter sp.]
MKEEFTNKITVIDSIMGSGKSTYLIDYMNIHTEDLFCYITPYRDEIERVMDNCSMRYFDTPGNYDKKEKEYITKYQDIINILDDGINVASTHALFKTFNEDVINSLKNNKYTLILDEVVDVVEKIKISKDDVQLLLNDKVLSVDENNRLIWINEEYEGEFSKHKDKIKHGEVYLYGESVILWTFPTKIFEYFDKVIISTYLFRGQLMCYYFQINGIEYDYKSVELASKEERKYKLCRYRSNEDLSNIKELINLYDGKLNDIGSKTRRMKGYPLTKTWYDNATKEQLKKIKDNTYNYFRHVCNKKFNEVIWTTFKDRYDEEESNKIKITPRGFKNSFVSHNLRATNEYKNRDTVAYLINRRSEPLTIKFLSSRGANINEDVFSLSELIQFIWRSAIRDNKPIDLYIPSERMRKIFISWLNGEI